MFTDGEAILMIQGNKDRSFYTREMNKANAEIRRLRSLLAHTQAELEDSQEELSVERMARRLAEDQLKCH